MCRPFEKAILPKLVFGGTACKDAFLHVQAKADWEWSTHDNVLVLTNGTLGNEIRIVTDGRIEEGAKLTSLDPLPWDKLSDLIKDETPGGCALNEATAVAALGSKKGWPIQVTLLDTGVHDRQVESFCHARGLRYVAAGSHRVPKNLVLPFGSDKLIIREPCHFSGECDANRLTEMCDLISKAAALAIVSPKNGHLAQCWSKVDGPKFRLFQPTGSLSDADVRLVASHASVLAFNYRELLTFATQAFCDGGLDLPTCERLPLAPTAVLALSARLAQRGIYNGRLAAVTLGPAGVVTYDKDLDVGFHHRAHLNAGKNNIKNRSGAGDYWAASWMLQLVCENRQEPEASQLATAAVTEWLGGRPGQFHIDTMRLIPDACEAIIRSSSPCSDALGAEV